jgi:hypothetical protein
MLSNLVQGIALDVAGLGLIGSGIYCAITGKSAAVYTPLFTLGGTYLGLKIGTASSAS